ncbi:MAG: YihY/virulence factor BrkB family protein [bacterium]|nr:YihY/virulence factor BrkB family protein [bacterium]
MLRKRVARAWARDLAAAEAARAAFYLSLASFPAAMVLFSLAGLLGSERALEGFVRAIAGGLPEQAADVLVALIREVKAASTPGLLSLSAVLTLLWAASVVESLAAGVDRAYRVEKRRAWWRLKAVALLLLLVNSLLLVVGAAAVLAGPRLALALGLDSLARLLSWPTIWAVMTLELWILYYVLPAPAHARNGWRILGGAATGTALWVVGTMLFRLYLARFAELNLVYGVLGGVLVWMLWLYLSAAAVFLGAEVAAVLERRWASRRPSIPA